jgi:hypothetical protein
MGWSVRAWKELRKEVLFRLCSVTSYSTNWTGNWSDADTDLCVTPTTVRHEREGRTARFVYSRATAQPMREGKAPRDLLAGAGPKSPSAAVVKSHGCEHKKEKAREEPGQMKQEEVERK